MEKISKLVVEEVTSISKSEFVGSDNKADVKKNPYHSSSPVEHSFVTPSIPENGTSNGLTSSLFPVALVTSNTNNTSTRGGLSGGFGNFRRGKPVILFLKCV